MVPDPHNVIERTEAVLEHPDTRIGHGLVRDLVAALKAARVEIQSHQETIMHTNDALSMIKGESRRQLDLNHFAANALQTAQTHDPSQNWQSLIERLRGERQWLGEIQ